VYDAGLFKRSTIERLAGQFTAVLEAIGTRLDAPILELPLLAPPESASLDAISAGRAARCRRARPSSVRGPRRAVAHRDRAALPRPRARVRRAEPPREPARAPARGAGLGAEDRVVVCVERRSISRSRCSGSEGRAVYVPLDPSYPQRGFA